MMHIRANRPSREIVLRLETSGLGRSSLGGLFLLVLEVILLYVLTFWNIGDNIYFGFC